MHARINDFYSKIIPAGIRSRDRFALKTIAVSIIICSLATWFNYQIQLDQKLTAFTAFSSLVFTILYYMARFRLKFQLSRNIFVIYLAVALNILWFLNGGSKGPTLFIYQAVFALGLFIIPHRNFVLSCIVLSVNLSLLFLIEYQYPHLIIGYNSDTDRLFDIYLIALIFLTCEIPLIYHANKNYKTEQLKAERSEQIKSAFLANMSHEIRTPMNVLLGFSELIRDNDITHDEKNQYLDIIQQNGNILLKILDNVLDLSKLEANTIIIKENNINLNHFLDNLKVSFHQQAQSKGLQIHLEKDRFHPDISIKADENILIQIYSNLISNAVKFTAKGTINIGYTIPPNSTQIHFFVRDTGIGIPPSILPFVFERFRQGDERLKRQFDGTGLGLTISKALVKLIQGKIWIKSSVNEGTTVFFSQVLKVVDTTYKTQIALSVVGSEQSVVGSR